MSDPGAGDDDDAESDGADGGMGTDAFSGDESTPGTGSEGAGRRNPAGSDEPPTVDATSGHSPDRGPETPVEWVRWFFRTDQGAVVYIREVLSSIALVLLVGLLLFAVSGIWPPMVAVESGSMNPHMQRGDLVFVMEEGRLAPPAAYEDTGVVTARTGERVGYRKFQQPGDVIVYNRDGQAAVTPIIHRAHFWVNESENWVANGKAEPEHLGSAESCGQLSSCPAPHDGFITKGDANGRYDQVSGLSAPVKPAWVVGTAEFRIPWLGNIRLWAGTTTGPGAATAGMTSAAGSVGPGKAGPGDAHANTGGQCTWA